MLTAARLEDGFEGADDLFHGNEADSGLRDAGILWEVDVGEDGLHFGNDGEGGGGKDVVVAWQAQRVCENDDGASD